MGLLDFFRASLPYLAPGVGQAAPRYPGALAFSGTPPFAGGGMTPADRMAAGGPASPASPPLVAPPSPTLPSGTSTRGTGMFPPHPMIAQTIADSHAAQAGFADAPAAPQALAPQPAASFAPQSPAGTAPAAPEPKHGLAGFADRFFNPTSSLGQFGRALVMAGGTPIGDAYKTMDEQRAVAFGQQQRGQEQQLKAAQFDLELRKANEPQIEHVGNTLGALDRQTTAFTPIYTAPTDAETYARGLGIDPGSKEWGPALQDFVLRSSGPTANGFRSGLEDQRQGNRVALEGDRQQHRVALKAVPTYGDTHRPPPGSLAPSGSPRTMAGAIAPLIAKVARGEQLTPGEQQAYDMYRPRGRGRGGAGYSNGQGQTVTPGGGAPRVPGTRANPAVIVNPGDERHLPKGTYFRVPDGRVLVR